METVATSLIDLQQEAERFVREIIPRGDGATLVTLSGDLGAGKTAFTKEVAKAFGVEEEVTSPTFVLEKIYALPQDQKFKRLIHIDAYRLESAEELAPLAFTELMKDAGNLIFLEWPERVQAALPIPAKHLTFTPGDNDARTITYA